MNAMESAVSHSCCVRLPVSVRCRMTPSRSMFGIFRDGMVNNMTMLLSLTVSATAFNRPGPAVYHISLDRIGRCHDGRPERSVSLCLFGVMPAALGTYTRIRTRHYCHAHFNSKGVAPKANQKMSLEELVVRPSLQLRTRTA